MTWITEKNRLSRIREANRVRHEMRKFRDDVEANAAWQLEQETRIEEAKYNHPSNPRFRNPPSIELFS